jgi:diketogulonate reductase-like aldo/keto reductase
MMTDAPAPWIELNNGNQIPALGLGVFLSPPELTAAAVATAIEHGYRLIDTAAAYNNERQVGEGIRRSGIDRGEVFVTTKLWMRDYGHDATPQAFSASLRRLGLDYVDLYLLHWPVPGDFGKTIEAYEAAEGLLADGQTRAIGVSNFGSRHLEDLISATDVVPVVNQVELHPYFAQRLVREADTKHGVVTQSWSPIGGVQARSQAGRAKEPRLLEDPVLVELASKYGKTPAQIVLRWHVERGLSAIPKSVRPERIAENIDVFDFSPSTEDLAAIDELDTGTRFGADPETVAAGTFAVRLED